MTSPVPMFLADSMLGKLARWLRALGCDAAYERAMDDAGLVERARREGRILLTRDRRLLERKRLPQGFLVAGDEPMRQLAEVAGAFRLRYDPSSAFRRCLECNVPMEIAVAADVRDRVPAFVRDTQQRFARCPACNRVFWAATHVEGMRRRLAEALPR